MLFIADISWSDPCFILFLSNLVDLVWNKDEFGGIYEITIDEAPESIPIWKPKFSPANSLTKLSDINLEENIRIYNNGTVFIEDLMLLKVK